MGNIYITMNGDNAVCTNVPDILLTSGSVGTHKAYFDISGYNEEYAESGYDWGDLTLEAVFVASNAAYLLKENNNTIVRRSVPITEEKIEIDGLGDITQWVATVHEDVLKVPGKTLYIGLQGLDESGEIVRCSTLAAIKKIQVGADVDGAGNGDIPETRYEALARAIDNQREIIETVGNNSLPFVVSVTGADGNYTANQTYEDTMAAYHAGRRIVCVLNAEVPVDNGDTYYACGEHVPLHRLGEDGIFIFQHGTVNPYGMSLEVEFVQDNIIMAVCHVVSGSGDPGGSAGGSSGSDGGIVIVKNKYNFGNDGSVVVDYTANEIVSAMEANKIVLLSCNGALFIPTGDVVESGEKKIVVFAMALAPAVQVTIDTRGVMSIKSE